MPKYRVRIRPSAQFMSIDQGTTLGPRLKIGRQWTEVSQEMHDLLLERLGKGVPLTLADLDIEEVQP